MTGINITMEPVLHVLVDKVRFGNIWYGWGWVHLLRLYLVTFGKVGVGCIW